MSARDRVLPLPLPLAQLVRRALHATSAVERHNCAYYLGEACLKLAAVLRIRLYLERVLEPDSRVARRLVCLKLPSVGQWCDLLRATNDELGKLRDAQAFPLARVAPALSARQPQWARVGKLTDACVDAGVLSRDVARRATSGGIIGFFELIPAYRNEVMAHGSQRTDAWYERFGFLLLDALDEVLASEAIFDGLELARPVLSSAPGDSTLVWQKLVGLDACATDLPAVGCDPAQLYFVGDDNAISVHPLLIARQDTLGRHQVGFLNRTVVRTRNITEGLLEEVRRVDYLDYATGDTFSGDDVRRDVRELIARTRTEASDELGGEPAPVAGVVVGDFELQAELGRGATGVVYRARQISINRRVALKILHPSLSSDPGQLRRFRREVAALARCEHANVVKVLTAGTDSERHYFALEYVDGADLGRVFAVLATWRSAGVDLRESHLDQALSILLSPSDSPHASPTEPATVSPPSGRPLHLRFADLFADLADGLQHLHDVGVVHRDIKPGNLMITRDGKRIVIMDLGSAHLADASRQLSLSDGRVPGTLRYMAPEQLQKQSSEIDFRTDVYSLGASLYELATGRRFFDGDNERRLVQQILHEEPLPAREAATFVPRDLATVLHTATHKAVDRRYPSAGALATDLRAVARGTPIRARSPGALQRLAVWVKRHPITVPAGALLALLASGASYQVWTRSRIHVQTHARCVDARGVSVGVGEVDSPLGRHRSCEVFSRNGKVIQATTVNGLGYPFAPAGRTASFEFVYSDGGELIERIERRRDGRVRQKHRFAWQGDSALATVVDHNNMRASLDGSDVAMYRIEYDRRGFPRRQMFYSDRGSPRPDADLAYGYAFETDSRGLITRRTVLSPQGEPSVDKRAAARRDTRYDAQGNPIERAEFGQDGSPVVDAFGVATRTWRWDDRGNRIEASLLGTQGAPVVGANGHAGWRATYDEHGNRVEQRFVDAAGMPTRHVHGYAAWKASYDERGRRVHQAFFDEAGAPSRHATHGCSSWRARYDTLGNRVEQSFFGDTGQPCRHLDGYSVWRARYDELGNLRESSYFDEQGRPTLHRDGVASFRTAYDQRGNLVEVAWFGIDGAPIANRFGYAVRRNRYDERGNVTEIAYLDARLEPVLNSDGMAFWRARFDDLGNRVEQAFFDPQGRPVLDRTDGVAGVQLTYDDRGRVVQRRFLGLNGMTALGTAGYATEQLEYGALGQVSRRRRLDASGATVADFAQDAKRALAAWRALRLWRRHQADAPGAAGLVVLGVDPSGAAAEAGVSVGDAILIVDGNPVNEQRELATFDRVDRSSPITVTVLRDGRVLEARLAAGALGLIFLER